MRAGRKGGGKVIGPRESRAPLLPSTILRCSGGQTPSSSKKGEGKRRHTAPPRLHSPPMSSDAFLSLEPAPPSERSKVPSSRPIRIDGPPPLRARPNPFLAEPPGDEAPPPPSQ